MIKYYECIYVAVALIPYVLSMKSKQIQVLCEN